MNENKARVAQWWKTLTPSAKQTLLDLNLEEGDSLPEEFVLGLEDHRIHPVVWSGSPVGHIVPGEVVEFLNETRRR